MDKTLTRGMMVEWVEKDGRQLFGRVRDFSLAHQLANIDLYHPDPVDGRLLYSKTVMANVPLSRLRPSSRKLKFSEGFVSDHSLRDLDAMTDEEFAAVLRRTRVGGGADLAPSFAVGGDGDETDLSDVELVNALRAGRREEPLEELPPLRDGQGRRVDLSSAEEDELNLPDEAFVEALRRTRVNDTWGR